MWKRLIRLLKRLLRRPGRGREGSGTLDARARFWSDVQAGQQEAEEASLPRPLTPRAKS